MKPKKSATKSSKSSIYEETPPTMLKREPCPIDNIIASVSRDHKKITVPVKKSPRRWLSLLCSCFKSVDPDNTNDINDNGLPILPPQSANHEGKKTLVLDLDETLVHSTFQTPSQFDFTITVEIESRVSTVYVLKRPGVDEFLTKMSELYEIVVFTASLSKVILTQYADPLLDKLDPYSLIAGRLFRESCTFIEGMFVKDLCRLGRQLKDIIILDNSPISYYLNPENAVPIKSWFDDMEDRELLELVPVFEHLAKVDDVTTCLAKIDKNLIYDANIICDIIEVKRAKLAKPVATVNEVSYPLIRYSIRSEANSPMHKNDRVSSGFYLADEEAVQC